MPRHAGGSAPLSYVISVSLGSGCFRHLRIGADESLDALSRAILNAFTFDNDHLHAFFLDNELWSKNSASVVESDPEDIGAPSSATVTLRQAGLVPDMQFKYLFDFGDEWVFQCHVLQTLPEATDRPRTVRSMGRAPRQYGGRDHS